MEEEISYKSFLLFDRFEFNITNSLVIQWSVMLIIIIISMLLSRNLKKIPQRLQCIAELYIESINKVISQNMGQEYKDYISFFGTFIFYLLALNIIGLLGIKPPTADYNTALGLGLISFSAIQFYSIKRVGLKVYFMGYTKPIGILLPINIMERIIFPISLSLRLFGNMFAASIIVELVYDALGDLGNSLGYFNWIAQIGIPIPLHAYFDLFDGTLQMVIFIMLSMINLKIVSEH